MTVPDDAHALPAGFLPVPRPNVRRPWSVGLATFLLLSYDMLLSIGGVKLTVQEWGSDDQSGIAVLTVFVGIFVTGLGLGSVLLAASSAFGRAWARTVLAILMVPTASVEVNAADVYLSGYPTWGPTWRMGLGFAVHVPLLVIGVGLLFLPTSWAWFAHRR